MTSYFSVWHLIDSTSSKFFTAFFYRHTAESQTIPPPNGKEIPIGTLVCFFKQKFPCGIPTGNFWILYREFPIFFKLKSLWGIPHRAVRPAEKKRCLTFWPILLLLLHFWSVLLLFTESKNVFIHFWGQRRSQVLLINTLS